MPIKAIVFDMEGVLMKTKENDFSASWAKALGAPYDAVRAIFHGEMNDKADLGVVTQSEFDRYLIQTLGLDEKMLPVVRRVVDEQCFIDWILAERILTLKQNYRIGLLSNYTDIMREKIEKEWKIKHLFHEIIISHEVGLIKPDPAIFDLMLSRLGVSPENSVIIDDRSKNIEGARHYGMHAIRYRTREQALNDLDQLLSSKK